MKAQGYPGIFNPLYVLITGSLGVFLALAMFTWNYPAQDDPTGLAFARTNAYSVWVFLLMILCCLLTVLLIPVWGMLIGLFRYRVYGEQPELRRRAIAVLILEALVLALMVVVVVQVADAFLPDFRIADYAPRGHSDRMAFLYVYAFLTVLPAMLGMILIHTAARQLSDKIESAEQNEGQLFSLVSQMLSFRTHLQNYLVIVGIILSLVPINTAGLRAILVAVDPANEQSFPATTAILFGLTFTVLLLLIYVPAHFALTDTSRKLRDRLCPLDSLATLKDDLAQRQALDELLQTNIGIVQNLKAGLITLFPLIVSLIAGVLGINVSLP